MNYVGFDDELCMSCVFIWRAYQPAGRSPDLPILRYAVRIPWLHNEPWRTASSLGWIWSALVQPSRCTASQLEFCSSTCKV